MQKQQRIALAVLILLLVLTGAGLFFTSEWGHHAVTAAKSSSNAAPPPVNLQPFHNAQALAKLAATPEEQDVARDALRKADHEVDFAFAAALYQASTQTVPSTPEIKAVLDRISKSEKDVAEVDAEIARLNKLLSTAKDNQKEALAQQLDLAKTREELIQDELTDADEDLERAGGDPQGRVQRQLDEYNASEQSSGGQLDLVIVGREASTTLPANNSFLSRVRVLYPLHVLAGRLMQAEQEATKATAAFSKRHDDLEHQLEQAQSVQSKKLSAPAAATSPDQKSQGNSSAQSSSTSDAIASYRSMTALQKRMSGLDSRIRNQQGLANAYAQWAGLAQARSRALMHALLISLVTMLFIALAVLISDHYLEKFFSRVQQDRRELLTLRAVAQIVTRAVGAILILLVIFGPPSQMATVLALAGAGLTVALKDFIVGFFGWFVLMGKNGIRQGDWVEINDVSGEVVEIGLFHTVLLETGNWNDSGHPTGRRVTFMNGYAIEGHYFNFSTSGQWLWEELQVALPADRDPYPVAEEIQKIVEKETAANARQAEQEWERLGTARGFRIFSAGPSISVRPSAGGYEILVRYVTRANERHKQRAQLYFAIVELLRRKNIPQPAEPSTATASAT